MNSVLYKIANIGNMLLANGAGRSNGTGGSSGGSWFTEVLSWLADAIVKIATVVWGWLITLFYFVVRFILNLIDVLQMFVEKLVGIEAFNQEGGLSALEDFRDSDLIIRFISNEVILKTFTTILGLGAILLIIFSIIAIVKNNYAAATSDGSEAGKGPGEVLKKAGRAIFLCLLVPFLLIFGILGSNAVLASVCNAIKGDNDLTIGGLIFTASSYEANKFREYASDGLKVPIYMYGATEVINPSDYATDEDMQVLFYKLASQKVYIAIISDDEWFQERLPSYTWVNTLTEEHAAININEITGSDDIDKFRSDCEEFYNHYFEKGFLLTDELPLNDLTMFDPIIKSIYESNWTNNKKYKNITYDFSSTYTTQSDVPLVGQDGKPVYASIIVNSDSYTNYESFATIELEYYVMADVIDYAIENNKTFYYVDSKSDAIKWSEIANPYDKENNHNIAEYVDDAIISATENGRSKHYYYTTEKEDEIVDSSRVVADSAFYVSYYNGVTRLYFSEKDATSEEEGATYIICMRDSDGNYIPLNQVTTSFRSSYLAEDYGGAIVARGIFETEGVFPKDYCLPTGILEQIVDENGNELTNVSGISPYALGDTYYESETANTINAVGNFFGKAGQFFSIVGKVVGDALQSTSNVIANAYKLAVDNQEANFIKAIGIEDLLVNKNIVGYTKNSDGTFTFYDKDGAKISAGSSFEESDTTEFDGTITQKTGYVILQTEVLGNYVVPWFANGLSLDDVLGAITSSAVGDSSLFKNHNIMVAEYTYDVINIELEPTEDADRDVTGNFNILADMNVEKIWQINEKGELVGGTNAGEFLVSKQVSTFGNKEIYIETQTNLNIIDGDIYKSDGTLFYGKETAQENFNTLTEDFINEKFFDNLLSFSPILDSAITSAQETSAWLTILKSLKGNESLSATDFVSASLATNNFVDAMMALQFQAGLAGRMKEYTRTYYSVKENTIVNADETTSTSGTITYYDKHNNELETFDYTKAETKTSTITLGLKAVSGDISEGFGSVISAVIVDNGGALRTVSDAVTGDTYYWSTSLIELILNKENTNFNDRNVYHYTVTYEYSYKEYSDGTNTHVLGATINNVKLDYKGMSELNGVAPDDGRTDPGYLKIKNNNVVASGQPVLSMAGAKGYISTFNTADGIDDGFATYNPTTGANTSLTSKVWDIKSQSEYDDYYIYFSRGDLDWGLVFDFCLGLPTFSLVPLEFRWVFRFKLGSTYDYAEDVVYRLQAGSFYLDYNFRQSTGIGMTNLFRMSAINPFVLIFSTVLILTILWQLVWGLIQRIYNIVLLFIMLPPCCSTMPMDDGVRFGKWKDEIIKEVLSAYGVLIMLNLYFVLVPIIKDVTSNLIVSTDLPTTITGLFSMVGLGLKGFASGVTTTLSSIGSNLASGNMLGSIGLGGGNMLLDLSGLTESEVNLLGYVNRIIYIIFFLVLTTMLKNGKELIKTVLNLGDVNMGANKEVKENIDAVKNNKAVELTKKAGQWAVAKGTKVAAIVGNIASQNYQGAAKAGASLLNREDLGSNPSSSSSAPPPSSGPSSPSGGIPSGSPSGGAMSSANSTANVQVEVPAAEVDVAEALPSGNVGDEVLDDNVMASGGGFVGSEPTDLVSPPTDEVIERFNSNEDFRNATAEEFEAQVKELKEEHEKEMAELQASIDDLAKQKTEITKELDAALERRGKAYAKTSDLKEQEIALRKANASSEEWNTWREENKDAQKEEAEAREEVNRLEAELNSISSMHQEKVDDKGVVEEEFNNFLSEAAHYQDFKNKEEEAFAAALAEEEAQKADVQVEPINANVNPEYVEKGTEAGKEEFDNLKGDVDKLRSELENAKNELNDLKNNKADASTISQQQNRINELENELKETETEIKAENVDISAANVNTSQSGSQPKKKSKIKKALALGALAMVAPIPAVLGVVGGVMVAKGAKTISKNGGLTATGKKLASKLSRSNIKDDTKVAENTAVTSSSQNTAVHAMHDSEGEKIDLDKLFNEAEKEAAQKNEKQSLSSGKTNIQQTTGTGGEKIDMDKLFAEGNKEARKKTTREATQAFKENAKKVQDEAIKTAKDVTGKVKSKIDNMSPGAKVAAATVAFGIPGGVVAGVSEAKKAKKAKEAEKEKTATSSQSKTTSASTENSQYKATSTARTQSTSNATQRNGASGQTSSANSQKSTLTNEEIKKMEEIAEKKAKEAVDNKAEELSKAAKEATSAKTAESAKTATSTSSTASANKEYESRIAELDKKLDLASKHITELQDSVTNPKETKQIKEMAAKLEKLTSEIKQVQESASKQTKEAQKAAESKIKTLQNDVAGLMDMMIETDNKIKAATPKKSTTIPKQDSNPTNPATKP